MTQTLQVYKVVMPKLGLTMTEATIIEWNKTAGDYVEKGEVIFTFESDKSALELEAPASGVLTILVEEGTTVPVMTPVAVLAPEGVEVNLDAIQELPSASPVVDEELGTQSAPAAPIAIGGQVLASPKARSLARERRLSLHGLQGSGIRGMVVSADLDRASVVPSITNTAIKATPVARKMAARMGIDLAQIAGTGFRGSITRDDLERYVAGLVSGKPQVAASGADLSGLSGLRGIIADRLSQGWRERPQVTITTTVDATQLIKARQQAAAALNEKVSYDALLVVLAALALREFPHINATLTASGIVELKDINIGVAVNSERGLLVPVVHNADTLTLDEVNNSLRGLADRALNSKSLPDDLSGGTFTITNLGMFGIDAFTPIINPPECCILGVGRIVEQPIGVDGEIVLRPMMALSLSFDHRLVDGAPAARFLARLCELITEPFPLST